MLLGHLHIGVHVGQTQPLDAQHCSFHWRPGWVADARRQRIASATPVMATTSKGTALSCLDCSGGCSLGWAVAAQHVAEEVRQVAHDLVPRLKSVL